MIVVKIVLDVLCETFWLGL